MAKKVITLGLCIMFLSIAAFAFAEDVYATKNGKKYHKEDCRLIKNKGAEKITKKEALAKGLEPCGKCFKDEVSVNIGKDDKEIVSNKKNKTAAK